MTISDLITRLSEYPSDMPIRIIADMGFIATDRPDFSVSDAAPFDDEEGIAIPTLFLDIG